MNFKHILYAVFPVIAGYGLKQSIFNDLSLLNCIGISCFASLFVYSKLIIPNIEQNHSTFSRVKQMNDLQSKYNGGTIDFDKSHMIDQEQESSNTQKPYTIIVWLHLLALAGIIASNFIN